MISINTLKKLNIAKARWSAREGNTGSSREFASKAVLTNLSNSLVLGNEMQRNDSSSSDNVKPDDYSSFLPKASIKPERRYWTRYKEPVYPFSQVLRFRVLQVNITDDIFRLSVFFVRSFRRWLVLRAEWYQDQIGSRENQFCRPSPQQS